MDPRTNLLLKLHDLLLSEMTWLGFSFVQGILMDYFNCIDSEHVNI